MSTYHYLIASLPALTLDDTKTSYNTADFKEELTACLSPADKKVIDLFYLQFDNRNLLKLLQHKDADIDPRGNYTAQELLDYMSAGKEGVDIDPERFPPYLSAFLTEQLNPSPEQPGEAAPLPEDRLAALYHEYGMNNRNTFVAAWFELNLTINNVFTALNARKYKRDPAPYIVGNTPACNALRTSNARDFGLSAEIDYVDRLIKIFETEDLPDRENKIDQFKLEQLEDAIFFNYFTVERLYAFLLQLEMIERRAAFDKEKGTRMFRDLIHTLQSEVSVPEEFK